MNRSIGLDLSFTRTGMACVSDHDFWCARESVEIEDKSFVSTALSAKKLAGKVVEFVTMYQSGKEGKVHMEEPFPNAQYSAGLYALDTLVYHWLSSSREVVTHNPTTLKHLIGHRAPKKSESVALADMCVKALGLENKTDHRICHDEAEALIYAIYGGATDGLFSEEQLKALRAVNPRMLEGYDRERSSR